MPIKNIDVITLKNWLGKGEAVLIDVREQAEYNSGHIPESVFVPLSSFTKEQIPDFSGKKLVMQCRSGARSNTAGQILLAANPELEIYNLESGILGWAAAGFEIKY